MLSTLWGNIQNMRNPCFKGDQSLDAKTWSTQGKQQTIARRYPFYHPPNSPVHTPSMRSSTHPFPHLSICDPSIHTPIHSFIHPPSIYLLICLPVYPSTHHLTCLPIFPPIHLALVTMIINWVIQVPSRFSQFWLDIRIIQALKTLMPRPHPRF